MYNFSRFFRFHFLHIALYLRYRLKYYPLRKWLLGFFMSMRLNRFKFFRVCWQFEFTIFVVYIIFITKILFQDNIYCKHKSVLDFSLKIIGIRNIFIVCIIYRVCHLLCFLAKPFCAVFLKYFLPLVLWLFFF